jgi:hypothetical protein
MSSSLGIGCHWTKSVNLVPPYLTTVFLHQLNRALSSNRSALHSQDPLLGGYFYSTALNTNDVCVSYSTGVTPSFRAISFVQSFRPAQNTNTLSPLLKCTSQLTSRISDMLRYTLFDFCCYYCNHTNC